VPAQAVRSWRQRRPIPGRSAKICASGIISGKIVVAEMSQSCNTVA
jgi:hypothetical protein